MASTTAEETQKALGIPSADGNYAVISIPIPQCGPKDVLVKVEAAGLNPADWKLPRLFPVLLALGKGGPHPHFSGTDGAGIVMEVGSEVQSSLAKGDRV